MLIFSRRELQSVRIHTSEGIIKVIVVRLDGNVVKLGFDAPRSVSIFRNETDFSASGYSPSGQPKAPASKFKKLFQRFWRLPSTH